MPRACYSVVTFLLVVLLLWLADYWLASHWQQAISHSELSTLPVAKETKAPPHTQISVKSPMQLLPEQQMENITISDVALPPVPALETKVSLKQQASVTIKDPEKVRKSGKSVLTEQRLTSQVYEKLVSDNSIDIEIAWPNNIKKRDAIFDYLYRCVGMQFGVMDKVTIRVIGNTKGLQRSAWLRVAQGELNKQEISWLQQSMQEGIPVRLFPKVVDWQLSKNIADYLGSKALHSLRAQYGLNQQGLYVHNIRINEQFVSGIWGLSSSKCSS